MTMPPNQPQRNTPQSPSPAPNMGVWLLMIAFLVICILISLSRVSKAATPEQTKQQFIPLEDRQTITTYCPCTICNESSTPTDCQGNPLIPYYTIAVDPKVIPLNSIVRLYIYTNDPTKAVNYLECKATDVGGKIKNNKIDLCITDHQTAQTLTYYDVWVTYCPPIENNEDATNG